MHVQNKNILGVAKISNFNLDVIALKKRLLLYLECLLYK